MSVVLDKPDAVEMAAPGGAMPRLSGLFRRYRGKILGVYALFNLENFLRLAQPIALGWAIDGLLDGTWLGVFAFALQHLAALALTTSRQAIDTRVFGGIYADQVSNVVVEQRERGVPVSTVAARSSMSREFVDFFELHLPALIRAFWSLAGALLMLIWFDWVLAGFCLALLVPVTLLNRWYARRTLHLSGELHSEQEREVSVIDEGHAPAVREHYGKIRKWWVRLSDAESLNTGVMELFILALIVASLVRYCTTLGATTGEIFAVLQYVLLFVTALDALPGLVRHVSRLRDVARRVDGYGDSAAANRH